MIGSLHSMSYLKPYDKIKSIIVLFKRSQKVNIQEQYEKYNIRAFDFHLYFVGNNLKAIFKYGHIEYNTPSVFEVLNYLNSKENTYVRIVLESSKNASKEKNEKIEMRFKEYCNIISTIYTNICFFGGYREYDSKMIYKFENDAPDDLIFYKRVDKLYTLPLHR